MTCRKWKAAIVQSEPAWFNKDEGVRKTVKFIEEGAAAGSSLIAFSEIWIPGYPTFLFSGTFQENVPLVHEYFNNSISAHGPEILAIRKAAADNGIYVGLGFSERCGGSLYMSQMLISDKGDVLMHRRKIKPTHLERTVFGEGTGDSLNNVVDTPLGKIGMLNCWEHFQPLLKYHTYSQGEEVHIAAWPFNGDFVGHEPWSFSNEANEVTASRMYALEGQAFVLVSNQPMTSHGVTSNTRGQQSAEGTFIHLEGGGNSCVYGPDGRTLTPPADPTFDGLIYCDIDLDQIAYAKSVADPVGHYSRPDLLRLLVDTEPKTHVVNVRGNSAQPASGSTLISAFKPLKETLEEEMD